MGVREPDDLVRARASSDLPSYPTDTQAAAPLPPTGGAAAAGLADEGKGNPDPSEQGERIGAVVSDLDSDEHAGKAEAAQRLMRALAHRGARLDRKAMGAVQSMLASRPTALIAQLGMMVERGSSPVHSPVGLLRSLLPEAVDAVEAEAKARAELRAAYTPRPDGKGWETPEQKARREAIENMAAPEVANAAFAKMLEMMG